MRLKISLNKHQWAKLAQLLQDVALKAPVSHFEVESCLLSELYRSHLIAFTYFKPSGKLGLMALSLSYAESYAMNRYFASNPDYNYFIRAILEPKLPPARS